MFNHVILLFVGEFLNFSLLGVQFFLTNKFLNNKLVWLECDQVLQLVTQGEA